ncbi:RNA-binding protein [Rothia sp. CCM 9416]|uniref:RNA-binding protein n=1 Tax=Rothia sp. CCM 9416 TaxID=3402655 RepID=UPI003ADA22E1
MEVTKYGLNIPEDLATWYQWQQNADSVRRLKGMARNLPTIVTGLVSGSGAPDEEELVSGVLHIRGCEPQVLVVLDSTSPTTMSSLVRPLEFLTDLPMAVFAPQDVSDCLPGQGWTTQTIVEAELSELCTVQQVLAVGHYLPLGAAAYRFARQQKATYLVVQHGLITPYAPPLPANCTLLAFSDDDARFWISGRSDVDYRVVGSQLFYDAAQKAPQVAQQSLQDRPVFLGQMHGAELPRSSFVRAGYTFCRQHGAPYRPHPGEKDKLSVLTHRLWAKMGIEIDSGHQPLNTLNSPVVSVFSTGVLEAAIRGVPAWVYHPHPPQWLQDFWERYGMSPWGSEPTPAPQLPSREPAETIAHILTQSLEN